MPNGNTIPERITALEVTLREVATNHLPHIEAKMDRIQYLLVTTLVAIIVGLITMYVKIK